MTKRGQFWLWVVVEIQFLIIVFFLTCIFLPQEYPNLASPVGGLKKIHDLAVKARQDGKVFSKLDVEREVSDLRSSGSLIGNVEVMGADSHWTVLVAVPRAYQSKLQIMLFRSHEWPVYVLSSDNEDWIEISPYGKFFHLDFNW